MVDITIIVKDGMVEDVLANTNDVLVNILDMDTDDGERAEELEKEYDKAVKTYPYHVY